jgi:hypothetical protein
MNIQTFTKKINVRAHEKWSREAGGMVEVSPARQVTVKLDVDVDALIQMLGVKAARNKSSKAVECGGYITATVSE